METLRVVCDVCKSPVSRWHRTRIRFGQEAFRRQPLDVCPQCLQPVLVALCLATPEPNDAARKIGANPPRTASHEPAHRLRNFDPSELDRNATIFEGTL